VLEAAGHAFGQRVGGGRIPGSNHKGVEGG
jgi:hypothetical protein